MPQLTLMKCDRCGYSSEVPESCHSYNELGWINVRLHGWADARGNTVTVEPPNKWASYCSGCWTRMLEFFSEPKD